jgi:hypothetical protein
MKFHPVGAKLFHADRRTDMTKISFCFLEFCECVLMCEIHWMISDGTDVGIQNEEDPGRQ